MKSKFFLILLSVSMATAALGVPQAGAYEPPPSKTETPAATEPTNRNQSALEVTDAEESLNSLDSSLTTIAKRDADAKRDAERIIDAKREKEGTTDNTERVYDSLW